MRKILETLLTVEDRRQERLLDKGEGEKLRRILAPDGKSYAVRRAVSTSPITLPVRLMRMDFA